MKTRIISGVVMISVMAVCMFISDITRLLFLGAVSVLCAYEMSRALKIRHMEAVSWILYLYAAGITALCFTDSELLFFIIWFFAMFALTMFVGIVSPKVRASGALATLAALVYPMMPLAAVTRLAVPVSWIPIFVIACLSTWVCDSAALFVGKAFGRHKVAPEVSPNKTVEGCIGGAVFSLLAGVGAYYLLRQWYDVSLFLCVVAAFTGSTMGQIGDLAASLVKRMAGIKDYSNLIPGHGGALDRVDSLLFSIPTVFFCMYIFGMI
jgi:phosphatidate cytidylyltransferase